MLTEIIHRLLGISRVRKSPLTRLESILGYQFNNRELLDRALTHRSILPEIGRDHSESNEQLEFLGDAVLDLVVAEELYHDFPEKQEGELSKLRSMIVNGKALQTVGIRLNLGKYIHMSENEARNGGRKRRSILEDSLEALIAALYVDGGFQVAKRFIIKHIMPDLNNIVSSEVDYNFKSQLLEYVQAHGLSTPVFTVISEDGPDHEKRFHVEVTVEGSRLGDGFGRSKKSAQQKAAQAAIQSINI